MIFEFTNRIGFSGHVDPGIAKGRRELSEGSHFRPLLESSHHPFAITNIAQVRIKIEVMAIEE